MIERIDRPDDPRVTIYARVGEPDWLRAQGLLVAEGRLLVRRLVAARRFEIHSILATPPALNSLEVVLPDGIPVYVANQAILDGVTGFRFHRGCLALARRPQASHVAELMNARMLMALEGIGNPDNVGGLFRVAAAFGVEGVMLDPASADPFYRKAVRTSMGAALSVPWARDPEWPAALTGLREAGFVSVAFTPARDASDLSDCVSRLREAERLVLMFGSEGDGLTANALAAAGLCVRIPITSQVDSLNVVVAAGIALAAVQLR